MNLFKQIGFKVSLIGSFLVESIFPNILLVSLPFSSLAYNSYVIYIMSQITFKSLSKFIDKEYENKYR